MKTLQGMANKYDVVTSRSELAIYYGWEYGIKIANQLLKKAIPVNYNKHLYLVKPLVPTRLKSQREADHLRDRVNNTIVAFYAMKNKRLVIHASLAHTIIN